MPVGECQQQFGAAAAHDGITLTGQSFAWLCEQGHFGLIRVAESSGEAEAFDRAIKAAEILQAIYLRLRGDLDVLKAGRTNPLPGDYFHQESRTLIEVDEEHSRSAWERAGGL